MIPGEYRLLQGDILLNEGRSCVTLDVANTADRPVQVGSHYHFYEVNNALHFDRAQARGRHLDIIPGTAVRFEPGQTRTVTLVDFGGERQVWGFQGRIMGPLDKEEAR